MPKWVSHHEPFVLDVGDFSTNLSHDLLLPFGGLSFDYSIAAHAGPYSPAQAYPYPPPPHKQPGYGYAPPPQARYDYPPQSGYGYLPQQVLQPQNPKRGGGNIALSMGAGLLGGLLIGDMIGDVGEMAAYDAEYDAGFGGDDFGSGFDF